MKLLLACLLTVMFAGVGCFDPKLNDAPFACGTDGACPPDYVCDKSSSLCVREASTAPDAGRVIVPDAPPGTTCTPGAFQHCVDSGDALVCNAAGNGYSTVSCDFGCDDDSHACLRCQPGDSSCQGDSLVTCSADGQSTTTTPCAAGCDGQSSPAACQVLSPSNLADDTCDTPGATARHITANLAVNTNTCGIGALGGAIVAQGNGLPDLCVYKFSELSVDTGVLVSVTGKLIPVFVATSAMTISGSLDVAGHGSTSGAGAAASQTTGRGGFAGYDTSDGGGGGGGATKGGQGGGGGAAGASFGAAALTPILPGPVGGGGSTHCTGTCPTFRAGGGGGGAVELVSCTSFVMAATGSINAGGGGGAGGTGAAIAATTPPEAGDGGGGGGAILIEAPLVTLAGGSVIAANGGGGGGGRGDLVSSTGMTGSDGTLSTAPASGGTGASGGGSGGAGGTSDGNDGHNPGDGKTGNSSGNAANGAGGGGGAGGRIRINTRPDHPFNPGAGTVQSPFGDGSIGTITRHHAD